jgi:hypothetical protein
VNGGFATISVHAKKRRNLQAKARRLPTTALPLHFLISLLDCPAHARRRREYRSTELQNYRISALRVHCMYGGFDRALA